MRSTLQGTLDKRHESTHSKWHEDQTPCDTVNEPIRYYTNVSIGTCGRTTRSFDFMIQKESVMSEGAFGKGSWFDRVLLKRWMLGTFRTRCTSRPNPIPLSLPNNFLPHVPSPSNNLLRLGEPHDQFLCRVHVLCNSRHSPMTTSVTSRWTV